MQKVTLVLNGAQWGPTLKWLRALGFKNEDGPTSVKEDSNIAIHSEKSFNTGPAEFALPGGVVSEKNGFSVLWLVDRHVTVPLGKYTAIVGGDVVKVGCQRIPHAKVLEIAEAIGGGWRPLVNGDVRQSGDEFSRDGGETWKSVPCSMYGAPVTNSCVFSYRRRV